MGLFDKLFGKKAEDEQPEIKSVNSGHEEDWDFYFSNVDDIKGSFYLDLGLSKIAPVRDKPNLVWISVTMNSSREDGLSSNEEYDILIAIEDRLRDFILQNHRSVFAGRLTTDGRRDFYFYLDDSTVYDKCISEAMVAFPSYNYDIGLKEDPEWRFFLDFMYPNLGQVRCIYNRRVIDNLEKNGDQLTKARPVNHWIYFKSENDRTNFLAKIEHLKFDIINEDEKSASGDFPFKLQISRIDNVDIESVDEYVLALWEFANECNGDYDGWETSVERE
ncbi:MAG: DUF695 domain-containing protein [Chitinophagaceae bacterium]